MSTFEPLSEDALQEIAGNCATETSVLARVVATAIRHLARAKAAEERADSLDNATLSLEERLAEILGADEEELLGDAATRVVRARDDAQARVRELEAMTSTATIRAVHKALGATVGQSVVTRAEEMMAQINDARAILGAAPEELLSGAAARVMVDLGDMTLAEAEPPQTFSPPISVTVRHACDHPFAEVVVGAIQDPAFLSLPMGVRLGLVVLRG